MEDHPITFVLLAFGFVIYFAYYIIKILVLILIGLYRYIVKKIKENKNRKEVNNNNANID